MTARERDTLRKLCGAATEAPWHVGAPGGPAGPFRSLLNPKGNVAAMQVTTEANAAFIAAAREAVPALLDAYEEHLEELRTLRAAATEARDYLQRIPEGPLALIERLEEALCQ